jgi:xanthine dehydrogenase accessory factor
VNAKVDKTRLGTIRKKAERFLFQSWPNQCTAKLVWGKFGTRGQKVPLFFSFKTYMRLSRGTTIHDMIGREVNELNQILTAYDFAQKNAQACVLATVTYVDGSSYRRPGARMLMTENGDLVGCVSGGCLERDLVRKANWVLQKKETMLVPYDTREDTDIETRPVGAGLGCNGWIEILLEPIFPDQPHLVLEKLKEWNRLGREGVIRLYPHQKNPHPEFFSLDTPTPSGDSHVYFEKFTPPISLTLIGAGYDAVALAGLAVKMGHDVRVVDFRSSLPIPRRAFAGVSEYIQCEPKEFRDKVKLNDRSVVVVMTHQAEDDLAALPQILNQQPAYVGLLGPQVRGKRLLDELQQNGIYFSKETVQNIYFPVGLDIGAETPAEIALSVLAEISAVMNDRKGGLLRERSGPIHFRGISPS